MYTQIHAWLNRTHPLPKRFSLPSNADTLDNHWLVFVCLDEVHPLHMAASLQWRSLAESAATAKQYVNNAIAILGSDQVEEQGDKTDVISALGPPPRQATPLYIITTRGSDKEEVVYLGKTTARSRFSGGHLAALKLHAPEFRDQDKLIYRCSITVILDGDNVALEWIDPIGTATAILYDVESRLIHDLQPQLNTLKRSRDAARNKSAIHVQNTVSGCGIDSFMHDYIIDQIV
ncbi:MAG: hypothetical protein RW306_16415 [Geobacteraceae bacterium]|nr:hypothetical protein [Geobacteraceae bacterium]